MKKQIIIVGAGPIGCYCAELLAGKGRKVTVLEEHAKVGEPVQCTGIVTKEFFKIVKPQKAFMVNRLRKVRSHAPDGTSVELKVDDAVIDRTKFDQYMMQRAKRKGTKFLLGKKVIGVKDGDDGKKLRVKDARQKNVKVLDADMIIGADGPGSLVGRHIKDRQDRKQQEKNRYWVGVQARARGRFDKDIYDVYFSEEIPGFFGWVVPESASTARIGIAAEKNAKKVFDQFIKRLTSEKGKRKGKSSIMIKEMQGGLIPRYDPRQPVEMDKTYVVGDAATQVKATTGGGLVPGLRAAEALARAINQGKKYKKELKQVDRELRKGLMIRKVLDRFKDEDYCRLIKYLGNKKIKKLLKEESRDRPSRIIYKSIIKEPRLLLLARTVFRAKRL
ncbi:TPA: NAD(P)/FAD-dependent oxidoreductase [Candidatus Woesearchaeota archaeon]|nr:NAD(P)/FAD-dependent oxidoreductase [Candidatus Woesearchaeota archaeon]